MKSINPEYLFKTFCIEHTVTSYLDLISGSDTDHRNKITWQRPKTPTLSVIPAWGKPVSSSQHLTGFFPSSITRHAWIPASPALYPKTKLMYFCDFYYL